MPKRIQAGLAVLILGCVYASAQSQPTPLTCVHSHNDYVHKHPLFDALDSGFCSVEADVYLVDGKLLVAHKIWGVRPWRTLQALYLDPLRERVRENGGRVYPGGPEFTLLIELKQDWQTSYPALREILKQYADMLTTYQAGRKETRAVTVIITGHNSKDMFAGEDIRYAALDGDLAALDSGESPDIIPWVSSNWKKSFSWDGHGTMPTAEQNKLRAMVSEARQQGRRVRFWDSPDGPVFWRELLADGVDLVNTGDLKGVSEFLSEEGGCPPPERAPDRGAATP